MYQIFTDYKPSSPPPSSPEKPDFPPVPPLIMSSYTTIVSSLSSYIPGFLSQIATFVISAYSTITPSVVISLAYRLFVFYASTRIIPAVRESGGRGLEREASLGDKEAMSRIVAGLAHYSPCILVAVYTHLLMQHLEVSGGEGISLWGGMPLIGGQVWRWINIGATSEFLCSTAAFSKNLSLIEPFSALISDTIRF